MGCRIRDDVENEVRLGELRLRAGIKVGEISRELEKAETVRTKEGASVRLPNAGKSKTGCDVSGYTNATGWLG
jgi:hypothetical protein